MALKKINYVLGCVKAYLLLALDLCDWVHHILICSYDLGKHVQNLFQFHSLLMQRLVFVGIFNINYNFFVQIMIQVFHMLFDPRVSCMRQIFSRTLLFISKTAYITFFQNFGCIRYIVNT